MLRQVFSHVPRRTFSQSSRVLIAEGDKLPNVQVQLNSPAETVNTGDFFKGKKSILFGVPGAFTPGCSKTHLPGYIKNAQSLKTDKGIDQIACVAVNDAFVMSAWGQDQQVDDKVTLLADPKGELVKAMELDFDASGALGNHRSKRFAAIINQDGKVEKLFVEPDSTGLNVSLVENVMKHL